MTKCRFFERNLKRIMPGRQVEIAETYPGRHARRVFDRARGAGFHRRRADRFRQRQSDGQLPWVGKGLGIVNFILGGTGLDKRKYPLQTSVTCGLKEEISIKTAAGFTGAVSMPTCSPLDDVCDELCRAF